MIQLPPLATHGAVQEADCTQDQDGGRRSLVAGRRNLLPKSRSADRTISGGAASHFLNLQDIPETQLEGWSSGRRGAGRERSAAVVEHRGILGKACRDGRLAARPARPGHLALAEASESHAIFLHGCCSDRRARPSSTPLKWITNLCGNPAAVRVVPGMLTPYPLRGICSRTMRNVVGP